MTTQEIINQQFESLKELIISQIKSWEYGDGISPFVHNPDDEDGITCKVNYIDNNGWVNINSPIPYGDTEDYHLSSLWIDELLTIYNMQCNYAADIKETT